MKTPRNLQPPGFTLVEIMVATALTGIIGGIIYLILNTGMILFAKNTSVNVAHQQARIAVIQMESDLHAAVSLPQLIDENRVPVSGVGPAAGISFHLFADGPFLVKAGAVAGQNTIVLDLKNYQPKPNQRLTIVSHDVEADIVSVAPGTGVRTVTLAAGIANPIKIDFEDGLGNVDVIAFITDRVSYVVQENQLRHYGEGSGGTYTVLASDLTATTPFSTPASPTGAPYSRITAAINLSTSDPTATARGFKSANMFLNAQVPSRATLCVNK